LLGGARRQIGGRDRHEALAGLDNFLGCGSVRAAVLAKDLW